MAPIIGILASSQTANIVTSSFESIASATGTGSSGTITFSSIPGTYKSLQLRMNGLTSTAGVSVFLRYNSDSGANYVHHWLYGNGTTATASAQTAKTENRILGTDNGTSTTSPSSGIIDIHDYASATKYKTVRAFTGVDKNGTGEINLMSGLWLSTSAITSITVFLASVNWTTDSTFALYGIKG